MAYLRHWSRSAVSRDSAGPFAAVVDTFVAPGAAADRHVLRPVAPPVRGRG